MISKLTGKIESISDGTVVVEIQPGISWEVMVQSGIMERIRSTSSAGDSITFHILQYFEGSLQGGNIFPRLIGFLDPNDREFFRIFTTVDGVGFKKALKALTAPISSVAQAIETGDAAFLTTLPGIGARTAATIVASLQGKTARFALVKDSRPLVAAERPKELIELEAEARAVLMQLGYGAREADRMIQAAQVSKTKIRSSEDLIKLIFAKSQKADATSEG